MPLITIEGPATEPIDADLVKSSARIDGTAFDSQVAMIIPAVRRAAERALGRRLITQQLMLTLEQFPCGRIDLEVPDVVEVLGVKYRDPSGELQTMEPLLYELAPGGEVTPAALALAPGGVWPAVRPGPRCVQVWFKAGYGDKADVPEDIRLWMVAHAAQLVNQPEGQTESTLKPLPFVDGLLDSYKVLRIS
ncbi:head-tail connector protein [Herbaspirillum seropedicae]|uniref:head-tail connector protein n=1 Tax=Herbaspirillum seropedicae TaxID=964 RepID=UPI003FCC3E44